MSHSNTKNLRQLWQCYTSGQFGMRTLEWHKRNTAGFADYVSKKMDERRALQGHAS